jgi:hypothetical protein
VREQAEGSRPVLKGKPGGGEQTGHGMAPRTQQTAQGESFGAAFDALLRGC